MTHKNKEHSSAFLKVFGSTPQLRLLDFFMDNPNHDFTRNEIMEAIGMAKRTLYQHLPTLLEEQTVKVSRKIGRAELYTLNKESPIVKSFMKVEAELTKPKETPSEQAEEIQITTSKRPQNMAAACVYISSLLTGEKRTQGEIAREAKVTEVTIRNRCKELAQRLEFNVYV